MNSILNGGGGCYFSLFWFF